MAAAPRVAGFGDDLAAPDLIAFLDLELGIAGVDGDEAVRVAEHDKLAVGLDRVAGGDADAVGRRVDRLAEVRADVDPVVRPGLEGLTIGPRNGQRNRSRKRSGEPSARAARLRRGEAC